ncbi:MAG: GNAT family N-acetyltransferase [Burkholderiales bacterium]|nr:GNAT family N-acetyltransferase [Burkholderiales bacterium]
MTKQLRVWLGHRWRLGMRRALAALPASARFGLYRSLIDCRTRLDDAYEFKIAQTREELESCFSLLHDAYVASGFMKPHPSGLRVTPYHALPTTTTLCAKFAGQVVGTLSIVRDGVFGFPMQSAFDISGVRAREGRIAEISALAIHPSYRQTGGTILFPLMKFMYEYCTRFFDTRHLVIAVNPNRIEMYESLLFFQRLQTQVVDRYDFANGAPAVGATLDLHEAPEVFKRAYDGKSQRRNLYRYFVDLELPQIRFPDRTWAVSNDPILTPMLVDYFFNQRTQGFAALDPRRRRLLHSIYAGPEWQAILPPLGEQTDFGGGLRRNPRFTFKCSGMMTPIDEPGAPRELTIVEISNQGFQARSGEPLRRGQQFTVRAELGAGICTSVSAMAVRTLTRDGEQLFGCKVLEADESWRNCLAWLEGA